MSETNIPIACDLNAIQADEREQHGTTIRHIFEAVQSVQELPYGYAFRLPAETDMLRNASEFIANERLCCPFLGFKLELEPQSAALWLHLIGGEGVKQFIKAEFGSLLSHALLEKEGLD
jgi:hypothetical protein